MSPEQFSIMGKTVSFAAVQYMVVMDEVIEVEGDAVVIGYYEGSELVLAPRPDMLIKWEDYHRFIVIIRRDSAADMRAKREAEAKLEARRKSKVSISPISASVTASAKASSAASKLFSAASAEVVASDYDSPTMQQPKTENPLGFFF